LIYKSLCISQAMQHRVTVPLIGNCIHPLLQHVITNDLGYFSYLKDVDGQNLQIYCICDVFDHSRTIWSNISPIPDYVSLHSKHFKVIRGHIAANLGNSAR